MDLRVFGLLGAFTSVFTLFGIIMGAAVGLIMTGSLPGLAVFSGMLFFAVSLVINFVAVTFPERIVLRRFRARETEDEKLREIADGMALNARVRDPRIYVLPIDMPNSFSTGRPGKKPSICITEGALSMNRGEIRSIIAHEMFHIVNGDTYIQGVAAVLANILHSTFILRPFAVFFTRLALSEVREYKADYYAMRYSKRPTEMASAIRKMNEVALRNPMIGSPAFEGIWMVNPFRRKGLTGLYSTHPPTARRVSRAESMGHEGMPDPFVPVEA